MAKWQKTINIKQFLGEDTSREAVETAARGIFGLLEIHYPNWETGDDRALADIMFNLEGARDDKDVTAEDFNWILDELYDWGDHERVWLGL